MFTKSEVRPDVVLREYWNEVIAIEEDAEFLPVLYVVCEVRQ